MNTQLVRFLKKVGTFDATVANEIRANGAAALGADGFNPPSLLGAFALGPYLHNGSVQTLAEILENVAHRSAGTGGADLLARPRDRQRLAAFLASIDASTTPFPVTALGPPGARQAGPEPDAGVPALRLGPLLPNPLLSSATLSWALPQDGRVHVAIYDVSGRQVAVLVDAVQKAGLHGATWDGRNASSARVAAGVYFARLETDAGILTRKLVVAR